MFSLWIMANPSPQLFRKEVNRNCWDLAEETLEKLGVQHGCIHFEAKSTNMGAIPIEINLRMGGDYVHSYIKDAWDVDMIEMSVKIALGIYIKIEKPSLPKKHLIGWDLHPQHSGILVQLDIERRAKENKHLEELHLFKKIGDPVLVPPDGYDYLGWLTVSGKNLIDAQDNLKDILDGINYRVVKFDPASSLGKTERKHNHAYASLNKETILAAKFTSIKKVSTQSIRKLHVGIACNVFNGEDGSVEQDLSSVGNNIQNTLIDRGYRTTFLILIICPKFLMIFETAMLTLCLMSRKE